MGSREDDDYWNNKTWNEYSSQLSWELDDETLDSDEEEEDDGEY